MHNNMYRGKTMQGKWVYGSHVFYEHCPQHQIAVNEDIGGDGYNEPKYILHFYEVIPETVGQYIGKTDKNKTKAFCGDVVKNGDMIGVIKFGEIPDVNGRLKNIGFFIDWQNDGMNTWKQWIRADIGYWFDCNDETEVIGSIHDNPELLESRCEE